MSCSLGGNAQLPMEHFACNKHTYCDYYHGDLYCGHKVDFATEKHSLKCGMLQPDMERGMLVYEGIIR